MDLLQIGLLAVLAESLLETLKPLWEADKLRRDRVLALVLGVVLAVLSGSDLFAAVGLPLALPYAGSAVTGIIASRGAQAVHDLLKRLEVPKSG